MSGIWSSTPAHTATSPFATTDLGPTPGGGAAAKFQSMLQSSGGHGPSAGQLGLSPSATSSKAVASPMDSGSGSSSSSGSDTTISANDFLTLLVSELQNQDPTADTDPNAYIDQLVQINSLEQLISINQNLSTVLGAASPSSSQTATAGETAATGAGATAAISHPGSTVGSSAKQSASSSGLGLNGNSSTAPSTLPVQSGVAVNGPRGVHGNLSAPANSPAAQSVAHALDGRTRGLGHGHALRDIPTRPIP